MKRVYNSGAQKRKQRANVKTETSKLRKLSAFFSSQTSTAMTNSATEPASVVLEEDVATSSDSSHSTSAFTGN